MVLEILRFVFWEELQDAYRTDMLGQKPRQIQIIFLIFLPGNHLNSMTGTFSCTSQLYLINEEVYLLNCSGRFRARVKRCWVSACSVVLFEMELVWSLWWKYSLLVFWNVVPGQLFFISSQEPCLQHHVFSATWLFHTILRLHRVHIHQCSVETNEVVWEPIYKDLYKNRDILFPCLTLTSSSHYELANFIILMILNCMNYLLV